ncbi:MAG: hypothetical protein KF703_11885 [Actinobacteria bacterium]|nr:hypothetical protein [Pseudobdellovibrionaceae bacterium]MBX3033304.1 hypothetical protein [Pseudobdellovibrionaceae bacterium]MBX3286036.1 hypothetical protein [Actinomycetota bacterium]
MSTKIFAEYFILTLPYVMGLVFLGGAFFRVVIWYTVKRHEWFAREFEKRVARFMESEKPGVVKNVSFYVLAKRMLERSFYEGFAVRDRLRRRRGDGVMALSDRVFLVKQGCAWLVKDILNQLKFLKWTQETPKLLGITRATFHHNPCFNRVFGVLPMTAFNDLISILPGLFVIAGILGTFVGIAGGLQELGGMNLQDLENTKNIMDRFLQEISFAMQTSIAGIVFSLLSHIVNVMYSPERVYVSMVDRFESSLDLLWYRSDNNDYPLDEKAFDEHRDPVEALAEDAVNAEAGRASRTRDMDQVRPVKAS